MYPKLFEIGPIPVYSYGLMLGIAFLVGSTLFGKELKRNKIDENVGIVITFLALIGGIVGAKVFYIIEEWNFGKGLSLSSLFNPDSLFSAAGLTFYGGLVFAIVLVIIYCKIKKLSVLRMFDLLVPATALGYGIARIGCHLSGDGCYGIEVNNTFWELLGYSYANGTLPTAQGILVHPTPLYEFTAGVLIFIFLWNKRTKTKYAGQLFYYYLILVGISRFFVEFIRRNPKVTFDLTQAQLLSILIIIIGVIMLVINRDKVTSNINTDSR